MMSFQTPQGVKDELFKEYEEKQELLNKISNIFRSFGYREVATPTIEYYEVFSSIKSTVFKNDIFKLIDKSGEILTLRPDATIPIARIVANNYKSSKKNYKLFYNTQVFKMSNEKNREVTQTGVEYFGNINPEADAEVISIAIKSLIENNVKFQMEIGNAAYYKGLLEEINLASSLEEELKKLIEDKNFAELKRFVNTLDIEDMYKEILINIPNLYGEFRNIIVEAQEYCLNDKMKNALEDLKDIYSMLEDYEYEDYISLDLGLINDLNYYTGVVFRGYVEGYGEMVLSGGRYDSLTKYYGQYIPATGFALNIESLMNSIVEEENPQEIIYIDYKINYKKSVRKEAIGLAKQLRDKGYAVGLERKGNFENLGQETGIKNILNLGEDKKIEFIYTDSNQLEIMDLEDFKSKQNIGK